MTDDSVQCASHSARQGPLRGLKVLELGQLVAAPFAGRMLADFGAEVLKIEPPGGGDPLRTWRFVENGTSLWWHLQARNKKSVTLDLRQPAGQEIARQLASQSDVLIENFRPGTLERWNLGPQVLHQLNPGLIIVRISGFGQDGPYRDRPGFGNIAESMGGVRYVTGYPDRPPVRVGVTLGDSVAALHAWGATLMALYHRRVNGGNGQVVDVALYEAVLSLTDSMIPEYSRTGVNWERTGNIFPGVAPSSTYTCGDGQYAVIGGNGDSIFKRLMHAIGQDDLAGDPRFQDNKGRAQHQAFLDAQIEAWTRQHTQEHVLKTMEEAGVPAGPIYSAADIFADPHIQARGMIERHVVPGLGEIALPRVVPQLSDTPGAIAWTGPTLGEHTNSTLRALGYSDEDLHRMKQEGVI